MTIKIPQNGKFSQPNNSDKFGNLWYTKNINLDEEGYIKLSPRSVSLQNSITDTDLGLPLAFGREANGVYNIVTSDDSYEIVLSNNALTVADDDGTSTPATHSFDAHGAYFNNKWYATDTDDLFSRDPSNGNWTDVGNLTSGKIHVLEVFANKNSLAVSDGNTVLLKNTSDTTTVTLTIPASFEVNGLAYNNNRMGISTLLSDTVDGQNQEAMFFVWNGADTSAEAGYPVGTDMIISVAAYKSSWVILTRAGNLFYFNGGGFDLLASFPYYFKDLYWGDTVNLEALGDVMQVDGDIIYIQFTSRFGYYGKKDERILQNCPGGVWCYDPKVGLYHRFSPSISGVSLISVAPSSNVNTTTNVFTTSSTIPATGNPIKYISDGSDLVGGISNGNVYYIIKLSATTFSLAESREKSLAGVALDLTSAAEATFMALTLQDFGATYMDAVGGVSVPSYTDHVLGGILFGSKLFRVDASTTSQNINFITTEFDNIGYFVTPKISSNTITDKNQKAFIKFRPLGASDKIIVKYKERDVIGLPVSTPQYASYMKWAGDTTLYTTNGVTDFSEAKSYLDSSPTAELEVEVISGAGAGQMAQVESITEENGVYSITLKDRLLGISSGNFCNIIIDNWKKIGEIDSTNTDGWDEFDVASSSPWIKFKVELRGSGTTVEEFQFVSQNDKKSV